MQNTKVKTIFVSFETLKKPKNVDVFVPAWSLGAKMWQNEVVGHLKAEPGQRISLPHSSYYYETKRKATGKLLILDTLNPLASTSPKTSQASSPPSSAPQPLS